MAIVKNQPVRFAHVDAAAIVFFPRYFEMLNAAVEDWFAGMGFDFRRLHRELGIGAPTVKLDCEFVSPSELGDLLVIEISPRQVGRSSCQYDFRFSVEGIDRLRGSGVLVSMDLAKQRSVAWPAELKACMIAAGAEAKAP